MQRYPMTPQGHKALEEELKRLKTVERPRISQAIAEAREHGDLKENAEYHAARERQGFCEGRIRDIEAKLGGAEVIDPTKLPKRGVWCLASRWCLRMPTQQRSVVTKLWAMMKPILNKTKSQWVAPSLAV